MVTKITAPLAVVIALGSIVLLPLVANPRPEPREIVLVARDMAFYVASDPETPNPTLTVKAGEEVKLILRNEDPGVVHAFAVKEWPVEMASLRAGEVGSVVFRVPARPGRHAYVCTPHARMMNGVIDVD